MYSLKSRDGQLFIFQNSRFPVQVSTWEKRKKNSFSSKTKTCKKIVFHSKTENLTNSFFVSKLKTEKIVFLSKTENWKNSFFTLKRNTKKIFFSIHEGNFFLVLKRTILNEFFFVTKLKNLKQNTHTWRFSTLGIVHLHPSLNIIQDITPSTFTKHYTGYYTFTLH